MRKGSTTRVVWASADGSSKMHEGDSLAFMERLAASSVDCIWTDPPYLLSNDGMTCVGGEMVKVNKGEWDRSRGIAARGRNTFFLCGLRNE